MTHARLPAAVCSRTQSVRRRSRWASNRGQVMAGGEPCDLCAPGRRNGACSRRGLVRISARDSPESQHAAGGTLDGDGSSPARSRCCRSSLTSTAQRRDRGRILISFACDQQIPGAHRAGDDDPDRRRRLVGTRAMLMASRRLWIDARASRHGLLCTVTPRRARCTGWRWARRARLLRRTYARAALGRLPQ